MSALGWLICGDDNCKGIAKVALDQLRTSIERFGEKAVKFLVEPPSDELLSFGPFCARVLLENSCAALVGRLDSFRMLYLSEFQAQPEYEHGKRAKSAFSWTGDVIPEEKAAQNLWNLDQEIPKISRALFSKHFEHVYWKPAASEMLDFASSRTPNSALADLLLIDPDSYIGTSRGRSVQLYSTLSKCVHWEFFTSALLFDESTVKAAIRDACLLVANLGLISHFIPTAYASLDHNRAVDEYVEFRRAVT